MTLASGTRLGFHEIVAPVGAGGMGEVYRARDTRLGRDVALKVLPAEMASSPERLERFQREARVVAALNHPHIVTIHSVEESGGVHFLTMELVEGRSLDLLIAEGPLPVGRLIEIATALADALAAAHERGIIHRDLKPANVMVGSGGRVKVLDFGLAKVEPAADAASNSTELPTEMKTQEGVVMGTVPYMSPEQVQGRAVDLRTDIFSLGIILYEMASGQRPFQGHSSAELVSSILRDTPRPLTELRADCPEALARVIQRCLEKSPADRFPSAGEVRYGLRGVTSDAPPSRPATAIASVSRPRSPAESGAAGSDRGSWVAVLPFKHGGAEADLEALADGLSEEIATGLSRFRYLSVVSSASAARLKGEAGDERALGARLGARYVLEGSLRKGGSAIRVSAQLVDTQTGAQLWSETYNRDIQTASMFAVQDDVAARIVATVADSYGVLVHAMRSANRQKDDVELTPVEWQFQYFAYREQITPSAYAELKGRLERAVERDGRQSDLWACLAQIFVDEYAFGFGTDPAALDRALAAARRAVELDRANQFALVALAQTHFFRQDLAAFGPAAERAMALNPLNTDAVGILGLQIVHTGEFERGAAIVRRAMELNANHAGWMHFAPLWEHFHKEEYEQALERANRVDVPGLFWPYLVVASACGHLGRRAEAAAAVRDLLALDPEFAAHARSNVGTWHFASGLMEPILEGLRKAGLSIPEAVPDTPSPVVTVTAASKTPSGQARADEGFRIAVRPFKYGGADPTVAALAEGLAEDIVTGLSRFSYLRVIARSPTSDVRSGEQVPGARYVMEGSIRQAGTTIRLAVQVVDATTGAHLWAESFDRAYLPNEILALQDELVPRIVSTVADQHGVLTRSIIAAVRKKSDAELTPYEAVFRVFGLHERMTPQEHAEVRAILERVVEKAPDHADCWAMLATTYSDEYMFGFNVRPDPLGRALAAAQRAVDAAPTSPLASQALAQALFFRRERDAFRPLAERTIALNRMDGATTAFMGILLACAGDWERGCAVADSAMQLNPHYPGWYRLAAILNAYRTHDYRAAVDGALRIQMPGYFWTPFTCAAAFGQLGEQAAARKALQELLAIRPEFARTAREELGKWFEPELIEHFVEGLVKAGLEFAAGGGAAAPATVEPAPPSAPVGSGGVRADEGFWVAVLPFRYSGANADLAALADGLTGEIVTGLSRFSYLRVIARSSTSRVANEGLDVRSAGKQLGARYVLEGNLRQAGTKLRLAVQLVDAVSGAHLWAENYERLFSPEAVFELQDELVPPIVSTVADMHGVLPRSMSEVVRLKSADQMSPYEALLRSFGYNERFTPEDLAEVRTCLERAVQQSPGNAECWAMLSLMYANEYGHWDNAGPDTLDRSLRAARTAVEAAPLHSLPYYALAQALFFKREIPAFRVAAERAVSLNPMDGATAAFMGLLIAYAGDWERGCALSDRGSQLNPNHPGWYRYTAWHDAYRKKDYRKALDVALHLNAPQNYYTHAVLAICYAQLGQMEEARSALREMLALKPNYAQVARELHGRWIDPDLVEQLMDGLRKAGLKIAAPGGASGNAGALARASATDSGAARADEGFWIAVLPFKYGGPDAGLTTLAEGLTGGIVTGLSRFSYLRVVSRPSGDRTPGARYVIEGSLRQVGIKLRLAVQLVDTTSGAHLWAEDYERTFAPDAAFEIQDDLVPRIVSTVADQYGALVHSMSESLRGRSSGDYSPHEAVLRAFGYWERVTLEEHGEVREILEAAVARAPGHSDCLAALSLIYAHEYVFGYNVRPDSLGRARAAAQRAVASAPTSAFAHCALAFGLFFLKDALAFRTAAERALSLNRMDSSTAALLGTMIAYADDWDYGLGVVERAKQLNPHHPGWYHYVALTDAYRKRDYRGALAIALKVNMPGYHWPYALLAAVYGQLGERQRASVAVRELLALLPNFGAMAREEVGKWHDAELTEHLLDGLRKAGLEIPPEDGTAAPAPTDLARASPTDSGAARAGEEFWVAVLPFKYGGADPSLAALADGLSEEIVTGLSRFSYLRVIARSSTTRHANETVDVRTAGKELGARYVMEGTLRQAGGKVRLAVQLVDAATGAHLWAETYERSFSPDGVFELQDDLAPRIVSTVADAHGVLPHTLSEGLRSKSPEELSPYEAVLRSFGYGYRMSPEEHAVVRAGLERAVEAAPGNSDAWGMLSLLYVEEYSQGFNPQPDPLGRALRAAQRAANAAPSNAVAFNALARAYFFRKEFPAFRTAAERAIELNPLNSPTLAGLGSLMAYAGDWEHGCALVERATQLNPRHPGWYWMALFMNAYRQGDYRGAIRIGLKVNLPEFSGTHESMAAAYGQLGERDAAAQALRELLRLNPDYARNPREKLQKFVSPELVEHWMDGLRKAGLEIAPEAGVAAPVLPSARRTGQETSGAARAEEGFWVAVLPFKSSGSNADLSALAEGLTEDIVTGLSRFSYLRVITRGSTLRYTDQAPDLRVVGKELGARYLMEGTLRQAGGKLRLGVQLVDAVSGAHLWAENYERAYRPEAVFELQDDLVPRIVSTVADMNGVLPRTMSEALRSRTPEQLSPYEAVVRSFGYSARVTPEELAAARTSLELAVRKAPGYADAWAMLAWLSVQDYAQGFNLQADSLASGFAAAQRAVEEAPSNPLAQFSLAQALFFRREFQSFRNAAERAVTLNPMNGDSIAFLGELLTYAGDRELGLELAGRAKQLNPNHPGWYWYADFYDAYGRGDDRGALDAALKVNLPGQWFSHAAVAAACGQLGQREAAGRAVRDLIKVRPEFAATVTAVIARWWGPDYVDRMIDGWRKAGLDVAAPAQAVPLAKPDGAVAIAVLPFSDMSPAKDQDYLCEGMAEEIMNALVRIEGIRVASRTSAFRARQDLGDLPAIARALSVNHVLEGSVRTAGARLRVTAQLTDVASGYQLWSERFDRDAADIFAVQDEIAAGVVEAVKARLAPGAPTIHARPRARNLEAYRSYLKGRHLRYAKEDYGGAIRAFEEATRLDPTHAPSWTGLAESSAAAANMGSIPAREACAAARKALATSVELEGESADSLHAEAFVALIERRWEAMESAWRRAIDLQPAHVLALGSFGISLCIRQKPDEGFRLLERAREADPLASFPLMLTGWALLCGGRPQEARRYAEDALSFEKEDASALLCASMASIALGHFDEGIAAAEHLVAMSHRKAAHFLGVLGWALAVAGRKGEARTVLQELRALPGTPNFVSEAWLLGALEERDAAFEALARAEAEYQALLYYTGLPGFDPLRADPRFAALLRRLELS